MFTQRLKVVRPNPCCWSVLALADDGGMLPTLTDTTPPMAKIYQYSTIVAH